MGQWWNMGAERGVVAAGMVAIVAAVIGGVALGAVLVVGGVVDPIADSEAPVPTSTVSAGTSPSSTVPAGTVSASAGELQLLDCRDGYPVAAVTDGDSVFVVGKDASGEWAAVRRPGALPDIGWLPTSFLSYDQDLAALPVMECGATDGGAVVSFGETPDTTLPPDTTIPPPDTTLPPDTTIPPPDTTLPPDTTIPPPDTTLPPDTTIPPPDTKPPVVSDLVVQPDTIYPGAEPNACDNSNSTPIFGSAYATVTNEPGEITASATWRYLPDSYDYSGDFSVSIEPSSAGYQLIAAISDLPQAYSFGISAPQIRVEITWTVTDGSGNTTTVVDTFDLGRCV